MQQTRLERLTEAIHREISELIEYELEDERFADVSVTAVKLAKDLSVAKVYFEVTDNQDISVILEALKKAAGFIRYQLSLRLQLRKVPELLFFYDETSKKASRIEQLLREEGGERP
ncbi:MAG: 30S ribosome-binding factor RbfA [Acidobacteriota bacterium]|nr:30S ribosome-binding factor RbfA [Blastocatellia bacterium]MDW8413564.1 30S ribosome-binding factor RbfA [Acidobacteriota bacterium]